jgi:formylmethanofuran dehydrogenase subunit E
MSNKKQTAVEWLMSEVWVRLNMDYEWREKVYEQAKAMEKEQSVICKDCGEIITAEQINNHLFMKVKGGGLIHWKC